jgi:short-subunit dehydrogenase
MQKRAIITGASEGIGRCYALKLAHEGWLITAVARNEQRLQDLVSSLGHGHDYVVADLATEQGVQACVAKIQENHYSLFVNNAGFSQFGEFRDADIHAEIKILDVNCSALMQLAHAYLNTAKAGDALINLSSITAWLPTPIQPTYVASKAFIKSFSENLWYQERKNGVYVQALCPGPTRTEFIARSGDVSKKGLLDMFSGRPEGVINSSYKALLKRRKPVVIPGVTNILAALLMNISPRPISIWLMGKVSDFGFK